MQHRLLDDDSLESSCIVANNQMNRERVALGSNGYQVEIGFDPIDHLLSLASSQIDWLDLCCGRGKALLDVGQAIADSSARTNACLVGVDLVDMFDPIPPDLGFVYFHANSLHDWDTNLRFDLITCVHGLHYVGDKIGLLRRACHWLKPNGILVSSIDLANLKLIEKPFDFKAYLQGIGFDFELDDHLVRFQPPFAMREPPELVYYGADDQAGPNYTGQSAVNSYYAFEKNEEHSDS